MDDTFLGPIVSLVRMPFDGAAEVEQMHVLDALDRLGYDPDNGVVWGSAHIWPYDDLGDDVDLGPWDRSP